MHVPRRHKLLIEKLSNGSICLSGALQHVTQCGTTSAANGLLPSFAATSEEAARELRRCCCRGISVGGAKRRHRPWLWRRRQRRRRRQIKPRPAPTAGSSAGVLQTSPDSPRDPCDPGSGTADVHAEGLWQASSCGRLTCAMAAWSEGGGWVGIGAARLLLSSHCQSSAHVHLF